jgi:hypothetical protein
MMASIALCPFDSGKGLIRFVDMSSGSARYTVRV